MTLVSVASVMTVTVKCARNEPTDSQCAAEITVAIRDVLCSVRAARTVETDLNALCRIKKKNHESVVLNRFYYTEK